MNTRSEQIHETFTRWLNRFQPPAFMARDDQAMQDEANALLRAVSHVLPSQGYTEALNQLLVELERTHKTRAWPTAQEIEAAGRATRERNRPEVSEHQSSETRLNMLEDWFRKFGTEMPGIGAPHLTELLVERGVLETLRQARFHGFALNDWQLEKARDEPASEVERRHHQRTSEKLADWRRSQASSGAPSPGAPKTMRAAE